MITEEEYRLLAKTSYNVDSKEKKKPLKEGDTISELSIDTKFEVLRVEDNLENGTQAMAVVPIDLNTG